MYLIQIHNGYFTVEKQVLYSGVYNFIYTKYKFGSKAFLKRGVRHPMHLRSQKANISFFLQLIVVLREVMFKIKYIFDKKKSAFF